MAKMTNTRAEALSHFRRRHLTSPICPTIPLQPPTAPPQILLPNPNRVRQHAKSDETSSSLRLKYLTLDWMNPQSQPIQIILHPDSRHLQTIGIVIKQRKIIDIPNISSTPNLIADLITPGWGPGLLNPRPNITRCRGGSRTAPTLTSERKSARRSNILWIEASL